MKIIIKIANLIFLTSLLCAPGFSFAANIFFDSDGQEFRQGDEFLLSVFVDTGSENINAVEGRIIFPAEILEATEVRDGNSSINFWVEKPSMAKGGITFSGITPGGLSGSKEFLFSVVFQTKKTGNFSVGADRIKILLNDGKGTETEVSASTIVLQITDRLTENIPPIQVQSVHDIDPPENFIPTVGRQNDIYEGKYFLVFSTVDKGSGIDYYEVREGRWGRFITAESPYVIKNQSLNKKIYIKATDKSGNSRVVVFDPLGGLSPYRQYVIFAILLIIGVLIFAKNKWLKSIR